MSDKLLVQEIAESLGLAIEDCTRLEIIFDGGDPPMIKATYEKWVPDEKNKEIGKLFSEFWIVKKGWALETVTHKPISSVEQRSFVRTVPHADE